MSGTWYESEAPHIFTPFTISETPNFVQMVAESCRVALDTCAYWDAWEEAERRINAE